MPQIQHENEDILPEFDYSLNDINKLKLINGNDCIISYTENSRYLFNFNLKLRKMMY
jgi:hypothetical protein